MMLGGCMYISLLMSWIKITGPMLLDVLLKVGCMSYQVLFFFMSIHVYIDIYVKIFLITITMLHSYHHDYEEFIVFLNFFPRKHELPCVFFQKVCIKV